MPRHPAHFYTAVHTEIAAKAIEEGWSTDKAELEVLRASRPKVSGNGGGPAHSATSRSADTR